MAHQLCERSYLLERGARNPRRSYPPAISLDIRYAAIFLEAPGHVVAAQIRHARLDCAAKYFCVSTGASTHFADHRFDVSRLDRTMGRRPVAYRAIAATLDHRRCATIFIFLCRICAHRCTHLPGGLCPGAQGRLDPAQSRAFTAFLLSPIDVRSAFPLREGSGQRPPGGLAWCRARFSSRSACSRSAYGNSPRIVRPGKTVYLFTTWGFRPIRFAQLTGQCDNTLMQKTLTFALNLFVVGLLASGNLRAQDTPAPKTQTTPAPKPQITTPPKTPGTTPAKPRTATGTKTPLTLKTEKDKVSYAIGVNIGKSMRKDTVDIDPAIFSRGMKDALAGGKLLLTDDEMKAALTKLQSDLRAKQEETMQKAGEVNKKTGEAFLAQNKTKEGVVTLPDGLQYKILKEGTGPKPAAADTVVCNYRGTLLDGTEFDSSYKRGKPATFPVSGVIKGWTEAVQLMPVGSKWQLFLPSELGYGNRGAGPDIGPNATLIFEVELLSIQDKAKTEVTPK